MESTNSDLWVAALIDAHWDGAHEYNGFIDPSGYWVEAGCPLCVEEVAARDAYMAKMVDEAARAKARRIKRDETKNRRDPYPLSRHNSSIIFQQRKGFPS